jgi:hypothetical protein
LPGLLKTCPKTKLLSFAIGQAHILSLAYLYGTGVYGGSTFVHRASEKNSSRKLKTLEGIEKRGRVSLLLWKVRKKEPRSLANYVPSTKRITPPVFTLVLRGRRLSTGKAEERKGRWIQPVGATR